MKMKHYYLYILFLLSVSAKIEKYLVQLYLLKSSPTVIYKNSQYTCTFVHFSDASKRNFSKSYLAKRTNNRNNVFYKINAIIPKMTEDYIYLFVYELEGTYYNRVYREIYLKNKMLDEKKIFRISTDSTEIELRIIITPFVIDKCLEIFSLKLILRNSNSVNINLKISTKNNSYPYQKTNSVKSFSWSSSLKGKYLSELIENFTLNEIIKISPNPGTNQICEIRYLYGNQYAFGKILKKPRVAKRLETFSMHYRLLSNVSKIQLNFLYCNNMKHLGLFKAWFFQHLETSRVQSEFDECDKANCRNHGECVKLKSEINNEEIVHCECKNGYFGRNCQYSSDCLRVKSYNNCMVINAKNKIKNNGSYERENLFRYNYKNETNYQDFYNSQISILRYVNQFCLQKCNEFCHVNLCNYTRGSIICNCNAGNYYNTFQLLRENYSFHIIFIFIFALFVAVLLIILMRNNRDIKFSICESKKKNNVHLLSNLDKYRAGQAKDDHYSFITDTANIYEDLSHNQNIFENFYETSEVNYSNYCSSEASDNSKTRCVVNNGENSEITESFYSKLYENKQENLYDTIENCPDIPAVKGVNLSVSETDDLLNSKIKDHIDYLELNNYMTSINYQKPNQYCKVQISNIGDKKQFHKQ